MGRTLRNCSAAGKVAMLRYYSLDKEPVSGRCEEFQLQPSVFYRGLKTSLENGAAAFQRDLEGCR